MWKWTNSKNSKEIYKSLQIATAMLKKNKDGDLFSLSDTNIYNNKDMVIKIECYWHKEK